MNERLGQFMREENITAAKLAEILQIQPSSISHLLSGRNKPNFDFIARILKMFTELNPDWLINGDGPMYRYQNGSTVRNQDIDTPFAESVTNDKIDHLNADKEIVTQTTTVKQPDLFETHVNEIEPKVSTENSANSNTEEKSVGNSIPCDVDPKNKQNMVEKIIVFYSDQTFSIYNQR